MSRKYVYRDGARVGGVPAEVVGRALERLSKGGSLTARRVVDAAADESHELHPVFPWDDAYAADQHRLDLARRLIRAVLIVGADQKPRSVYVHVEKTGESEGEYRPLDVVVSQPDAFVLALAEAMRRLSSAKDAIDELQHAANGVKPDDYVARIALAAQALSTAEQAVRALH